MKLHSSHYRFTHIFIVPSLDLEAGTITLRHAPPAVYRLSFSVFVSSQSHRSLPSGESPVESPNRISYTQNIDRVCVAIRSSFTSQWQCGTLLSCFVRDFASHFSASPKDWGPSLINRYSSDLPHLVGTWNIAGAVPVFLLFSWRTLV